MSENQHTPLWKQLLGAATGATVAILLYGGFVAVLPNLSGITAYLLSDFEEKIEDMPAYKRSPRTIRGDAIAWREALGDRARAATAKLQKGERYFQAGQTPPSSSSVSLETSISPIAKEKEETSQKVGMQKKEDKEGHEDAKRKEGKLPNTGIPLWAVGGMAFCLAMSLFAPHPTRSRGERGTDGVSL